MKKKKRYQNDKDKNFTRVNNGIRFTPIMVISETGEQLGVMATDDARKRARRIGLDLVEVAPQARPPVCRIMDYGKFKFDQSLKDKKQRQNQKSTQPKEVRLRPGIAEHDIEVKVNRAKSFLEAGHKVNLKLEYKRRENAHKDLGFDVMNKVVESLGEAGTAAGSPKLAGRFLTCTIDPA